MKPERPSGLYGLGSYRLMKEPKLNGGKQMICKQPDKDVPGMICGHPLPCPYHAVKLNLASLKISSPFNKTIPLKQYIRLKRIGETLKETLK